MIDVKKMCKEKGLRMTEQRNIIADVITEMSINDFDSFGSSSGGLRFKGFLSRASF